MYVTYPHESFWWNPFCIHIWKFYLLDKNYYDFNLTLVGKVKYIKATFYVNFEQKSNMKIFCNQYFIKNRANEVNDCWNNYYNLYRFVQSFQKSIWIFTFELTHLITNKISVIYKNFHGVNYVADVKYTYLWKYDL